MTRTVITLPRRTLERLKKAAADRQISTAALMREALDEKVEATEKVRPKSISLGAYESGNTDSVADLGRELGEPRTWRS